jgi:hypothetical protein
LHLLLQCIIHFLLGERQQQLSGPRGLLDEGAGNRMDSTSPTSPRIASGVRAIPAVTGLSSKGRAGEGGRKQMPSFLETAPEPVNAPLPALRWTLQQPRQVEEEDQWLSLQL